MTLPRLMGSLQSSRLLTRRCVLPAQFHRCPVASHGMCIDIMRRSRHRSIESLREYIGYDATDDFVFGMAVHAGLAGENLSVGQIRSTVQEQTSKVSSAPDLVARCLPIHPST